MSSTGFAATASGDKYIQQLVKHWSHKFATTYADGVGVVPFSEQSRATFTARTDGIVIELVAPATDADANLRSVIERHIDRFAFREAPLTYQWGAA